MNIKSCLVLSAVLAVGLQGCGRSSPEAPPSPYEPIGVDDVGRTYFLDTQAFGTRRPFAGEALRTATVIIRHDSGYADAANVSIACSSKRWRQGAFAGDLDKPTVIPQNWERIESVDLQSDHPMWKVVSIVCAR